MEIPRERRITIVAIFLGACLFALVLAVLAMRSLPLALGAWLGVIALTMVFVEPFIGLLNYLALLYIRPQDFVPALAGMPIMLAVGTGTLLLVIVHRAVRQRSLVVAGVPQHALVLWFYGAIVASQLAIMHISGAMAASLEFIPTAVLYFLIVELVTTPRRVKIVFLLLAHLTLALAVQGLAQHFTGAGFGGKQAFLGRIQAIGIFSDPNDLALVILTVLPLMVLVVMQSPSIFARAYAGLVSLVFLYAIMLTQSRGGLLSLAAMAFLIFRRKFGRIVGAVGGVVVLAALVLLGPRMNTISTQEASSYGRLEAWVVGVGLFQHSPLFGVGFRNFMEYHFRTAHNSFVLCASELGVFGLYPWLMLLMITYKNAHFVEKELLREKQRGFAMYVYALRLGLVTFVVGAMFLSRTYHPLLFVLIGLCAATTRVFVANSPQRYKLIEKRDFVMGLLLMVGSLIGFKVFMLVAW